MAEIKTPPLKFVFEGVKYEGFNEDHTLSDIARWICKNRVDAEELVRLINEELNNAP